MVCPSTTNWMSHKPTMEELKILSVEEVVGSCFPTAELTIALPAAIAARLSPHDADAPAVSPVATTAHITSFVQVAAKIVFIIVLLLSVSNQAVKRLVASPSTRSRPYLCLANNFPAMQTGSRALHFHNTV